MHTRRTFIGWLGALGSAMGLGARSALSSTGAEGAASAEQSGSLDPQLLARLAEAVLPSELGSGGTTRVARSFAGWIGGFRKGAELVHPYGSTELQFAGESPLARWRAQLGAMDRLARERHRRGFAALTPDERRDVVAAALGDDRSARMPDPLAANHVAVALMAWFYASPEASNLCYRARIDASQCRPLANSARQPLPLAGLPARPMGPAAITDLVGGS